VGSNRRLSNLLKLIRSLQALTSMTPTDICGLPTQTNGPPLGVLVPRPTATETSSYRGSLSALA
jgi:hypothetical protein